MLFPPVARYNSLLAHSLVFCLFVMNDCPILLRMLTRRHLLFIPRRKKFHRRSRSTDGLVIVLENRFPHSQIYYGLLPTSSGEQIAQRTNKPVVVKLRVTHDDEKRSGGTPRESSLIQFSCLWIKNKDLCHTATFAASSREWRDIWCSDCHRKRSCELLFEFVEDDINSRKYTILSSSFRVVHQNLYQMASISRKHINKLLFRSPLSHS